MEWQTIDTVPEVKGKYFFCHLAWGPEEDRCTGSGFSFGGKWFVAAIFHKHAPFDECQFEYRQIEVEPSHWFPLPKGPNPKA